MYLLTYLPSHSYNTKVLKTPYCMQVSVGTQCRKSAGMDWEPDQGTQPFSVSARRLYSYFSIHLSQYRATQTQFASAQGPCAAKNCFTHVYLPLLSSPSQEAHESGKTWSTSVPLISKTDGPREPDQRAHYWLSHLPSLHFRERTSARRHSSTPEVPAHFFSSLLRSRSSPPAES